MDLLKKRYSIVYWESVIWSFIQSFTQSVSYSVNQLVRQTVSNAVTEDLTNMNNEIGVFLGILGDLFI